MGKHLVFLVTAFLLAAGCLSSSGGERRPGGTQSVSEADAVPFADLLLPPGVGGEVVVANLSFPTGVAWDESGSLFVAESGLGRIVRVGPDGDLMPVPTQGVEVTPWLSDITFFGGEIYFSSSGQVGAVEPATGRARVVIQGLPTWGDHRTNEVVFGPGGRLYVSLGTVTNSGVLGLDQAGIPNAVNDIVHERPDLHDVPCRDVRLSGVSYETPTPSAAREAGVNAYGGAGEAARVVRAEDAAEARALEAAARARGRAVTGPFQPFGTATHQGQAVPGASVCSGSVLSMTPRGGDVRVEAWGFRNPFGIQLDDAGNLWVTDNGYDNRGSRPIGGAPEPMYRIALGDGERGRWYGWPDYTMGHALTDPFFQPLFGDGVAKLLLEDPNPPPGAFTFLGGHTSANKFDFAPSGSAYAGDAFVALFGTLGVEYWLGARAGMSVARVDVETGRVTDFIVPASRFDGRFRPVEAAFGPDGRLYVVDFGHYLYEPGGGNATHGYVLTDKPVPGTGRILAFSLPSGGPEWEGTPAGNPGGDGHSLREGALDDAGGAAAKVIHAVEYGFAAGGGGAARAGEPVVFRNEGGEGHTVTADDGSFNSGFAFPPGGAFTWTPTEPGTYAFYCAIHPGMRGEVVVSE